MKKRLLISACALSLLCPVALAQTTLTISSWLGNDELITAVLDGFTEQNPDIEVEVVGGLGYDDYHPALNNKLSSGSAEDIVSIGGDFIVSYVDSPLLADLRQFGADEAYTDKFVQSQVADATGSDGGLFALPNDAPPTVLFYRRDLFEEAGLDINEAVSSWEAFIEAGEVLKEQGSTISAGAGGVATLAIRSNIPEGESVYFDADGQPVLESERFVNAFTLAKQIHDQGLDADADEWTPEWYEAINSGGVATVASGSWFENILKNDVDPDGEGLWGVVLPPEQALSINGGAFYAVSESSQNKEAAWQLIEYLTSPEALVKIFEESGNLPANLEALDDPVFSEEVPYFANQAVREVYAEASRAIRPIASDANFALAESLTFDALVAVIEQDADIRTALAEAQSLLERRISR